MADSPYTPPGRQGRNLDQYAESIDRNVARAFSSIYGETDSEREAGATIVNPQYPALHVLRYGTNTTPGTTDMSSAIQAAIDVAAADNGGGDVILPAGVLKVDTTLELPGSVTLRGVGWNPRPGTFSVDEPRGTTILSDVGAGNATIRIGNSGSSLADIRGMRCTDLRIYGDTGLEDGIVIENADSDFVIGVSLHRIACFNLRYGFHFAGTSWWFDCAVLHARECDEGFRFTTNECTTSTFLSCYATHCTIGWHMVGNGSYNTLVSCVAELGEIGFLFDGVWRATTLISPGVELITDAGIRFNNGSCEGHLVNPYFHDHSGSEAVLIDVQAVNSLTIETWRVLAAFAPMPPGTSLNVEAGFEDRVLLLNCRLEGTSSISSYTSIAGGTTNAFFNQRIQTAGLGISKTPVTQQPNIADPSGVTTDEDVEARAAISSILDLLEAYGLMAD